MICERNIERMVWPRSIRRDADVPLCLRLSFCSKSVILTSNFRAFCPNFLSQIAENSTWFWSKLHVSGDTGGSGEGIWWFQVFFCCGGRSFIGVIWSLNAYTAANFSTIGGQLFSTILTKIKLANLPAISVVDGAMQSTDATPVLGAPWRGAQITRVSCRVTKKSSFFCHFTLFTSLPELLSCFLT